MREVCLGFVGSSGPGVQGRVGLEGHMMTRRTMLTLMALGTASVASGASPLQSIFSIFRRSSAGSLTDVELLEEIQRASFRLFWEGAHPRTGLVKDRVRFAGRDSNTVSSIAGTGFGLTALCLADEHGWIRHRRALKRARITLRYLWRELPNHHGFFYHFVDWETGGRRLDSEVSSMDTALLLCGVLTCRQHFDDDEIRSLATAIVDRVDWRWMYQAGPFLNHGWTPERGFLQPRWDTYSEHMLLYLLAMGASQNTIPAQAWNAWDRPWFDYEGLRYIDSEAPLFIHQYSHAWFDFRGVADAHTDYFQNSVLATQAHRNFCLELRDRYSHFGEDLWGITASESRYGYAVWGGPPKVGPIDGSVVPCAAGGSLPFLREGSLQVLRSIRERFDDMAWSRYGFADAFNPATGWVAGHALSINTGITLLMIENARTGRVWELFMRNPEARRGMQLAGFRKTETAGLAGSSFLA